MVVVFDLFEKSVPPLSGKATSVTHATSCSESCSVPASLASGSVGFSSHVSTHAHHKTEAAGRCGIPHVDLSRKLWIFRKR